MRERAAALREGVIEMRAIRTIRVSAAAFAAAADKTKMIFKVGKTRVTFTGVTRAQILRALVRSGIRPREVFEK